MKAENIRVEYLKDPIGIDIRKPRFSWTCNGGIKQSAYQILCKKDDEVYWDSGKVASDQMNHILYQGKKLLSRDHIDVSITLWDENDDKGEASGAFFEMGLLAKEDFKAKWIAGDYVPQKNVRYPLDLFRKTFDCKKEIRKARLYISACGIYTVSINDEKLDTLFMPGSTDYRKRLQYQTYDVTELLKENNDLKIALGDGWYRGSLGAFGFISFYGKQTKLYVQLEITYADGSNDLVLSDSSFDWCNDGPVRFNDMQDGEIYDSSMVPTYSRKAIEVKGVHRLVASDNVYVSKHESFEGKFISDTIVDFSQNIAGTISLDYKGKKGEKIKITLGETLKDGRVNMEPIQCKRPAGELSKLKQNLVAIYVWNAKSENDHVVTPKQEVVLYCSGNEDHYEMEFAVCGFRYAQIEGKAAIKRIESHAVYSNLEQIGFFHCGDGKLNQLFANALWSMKGNYLDIPTDCPTRERMGWTGDGQVFFDTAAYLMDIPAFYRKWLNDFEDAQLKDGKMPAVIPAWGAEMMYNSSGGSTGWHDAAILLPYRFYLRYNDRSILEKHYEMMKKAAMFMVNNAGPIDKKLLKQDDDYKYLYEKGVHLGEWLEPVEFQDKISTKKLSVKTEESTAYMHYTLDIMSKVSTLLGKEEDAKLFKEYADGAKRIYRKKFLNPIPDTDRYAKLVRPIALGLGNEEEKTLLAERLAKAVVNKDYRVMTGFLSTPFLLSTLADAGYVDLAEKVLKNEKSPGWLYEVNNGATTIWESWEGDASLNHYSPGAVVSYFFEYLAGIKIDGNNHFAICPVKCDEPFEVTYRSQYGQIFVKHDDEGYEISIPANTSALINIGTIEEEYSAGKYRFER
ncbi:MAG: family 78 glycoside hydrolase catalytic domain [Erysipelotrichaceae bacterium]|nr:family 78 glycoside hydrolase catalytic domain [Erysipelotrichaceae bacterium]